MSYRIAAILPPRENFSSHQAGAVALCVQDFCRYSRFSEEILIVGNDANAAPEGVAYVGVPLKGKWYHSASGAYAYHVQKQLAAVGESLALLEVHNRPALARKLAGFAAAKEMSLALHLHNDPQEMKGAATPAERAALLRSCQAVYCVSAYIQSRFLEGLKALVSEAERAKVRVIYNGLSLPVTADLPQKEKQIVFAGRLAETKGGLVFAQALALAMPQLPDWKAVIIGADRHQKSAKPNDYEQALATALEKLPTDQVECTGFLPHAKVLEQYAHATIAVVPSLWAEPFGRTALEAMAYGAALISSISGGLAEVVGEAALAFEAPKTPEKLAGLMVELASSPLLQEKMRVLSQFQAQKFSIEKVTASLDDVRQMMIRHSLNF